MLLLKNHDFLTSSNDLFFFTKGGVCGNALSNSTTNDISSPNAQKAQISPDTIDDECIMELIETSVASLAWCDGRSDSTPSVIWSQIDPTHLHTTPNLKCASNHTDWGDDTSTWDSWLPSSSRSTHNWEKCFLAGHNTLLDRRCIHIRVGWSCYTIHTHMTEDVLAHVFDILETEIARNFESISKIREKSLIQMRPPRGWLFGMLVWGSLDKANENDDHLYVRTHVRTVVMSSG